MKTNDFNLLLADDDRDDCSFFQEALEELPLTTNLRIVNDGVQLMDLLNSPGFDLPDVLFLDLNMPRKSWFDCLKEIKQNEKLKQIPIIVFSTSFDKEYVIALHVLGANYFMQKPPEFEGLKKNIAKSLELVSGSADNQTLSENFVISKS